jgi:hypothetical protein
MSQATEHPTTSRLITSRRSLIRAFGVTAAGAAVTVPIVTIASAEERLRHHMEGLERAFQDLFPTAAVAVRGNCRLRDRHGEPPDGERLQGTGRPGPTRLTRSLRRPELQARPPHPQRGWGVS